ncbi:hypothetical protein DFH94DRAFT_777285 [Russula ochroleuca]|uniref:Secreted protein n=1 Tax=Russula ochroleuca TaxID=152965 RepID=A0A9P5JW37_9AGAM|nr:hypothetical protein DFH94DRAFT_777285 [Russula ochroleuca]
MLSAIILCITLSEVWTCKSTQPIQILYCATRNAVRAMGIGMLPPCCACDAAKLPVPVPASGYPWEFTKLRSYQFSGKTRNRTLWCCSTVL